MEHLCLYQQADLALDTFPYNGTTTTCEALWMGVPVISLAGQTHVGRVGVSLLSRVGLEGLLARTTNDYVELAVSMAADRDSLAFLRAGLRQRLRDSSLLDRRRWCPRSRRRTARCGATGAPARPLLVSKGPAIRSSDGLATRTGKSARPRPWPPIKCDGGGASGYPFGR
jgi:hypothetical protein